MNGWFNRVFAGSIVNKIMHSCLLINSHYVIIKEQNYNMDINSITYIL